MTTLTDFVVWLGALALFAIFVAGFFWAVGL